MKYEPIHPISDLDIEFWRWIIERYAAKVDDVCEIRGIKRRMAYEHIARWVEKGYFYRKKGGFILPTRRTYIECAVPYKFHDIGFDFLWHAADVTKVEHYLRKREDMIVMNWTGERYLRHLRGFPDGFEYSRATSHIPDAECEILSKASGVIQRVAIEVERTAKSRERTNAILKLLSCKYDHIWYFADVTRVYQMLKTCIEEMPAADIPKFHLWKLDTITGERKTHFTSDITHI
jgi:hypothetical protein